MSTVLPLMKMLTNNRRLNGTSARSIICHFWIHFSACHINIYNIYSYGMEFYSIFHTCVVNLYDL